MKIEDSTAITMWYVLGALLIPYSFISYIINTVNIVNKLSLSLLAFCLYLLFVPAFFTIWALFVFLGEKLPLLFQENASKGIQALVLIIAILPLLYGIAFLPFSDILVLLYSAFVIPLWIAPVIFWQLSQENAKRENTL